MSEFDSVATVARESEDGLSKTVYTARLTTSCNVTIGLYAYTRTTKRHSWTDAPQPPTTPLEVIYELAGILAERVRAATMGAER